MFSGLDPRKWLDCPDEFPPVLILEELDKVKVSEYKLKSLYTIMNMIFEAGGSVISTSNFTSKEIQERYPDWFYRRLVESSIDRLIRHRDLHKVVGRGRKKAAVEKNEAVEVPEVVNA